MVTARGWGERENASCCSMGIKFQLCKMKSSRDLLYNVAVVINNIVFYT